MSKRLDEASTFLKQNPLGWSSAQTERSWGRLQHKRRRRRLAQGALTVLVLFLSAGVIARWSNQETDPTLLKFADGSTARLSSPLVARVVEQGPASVIVELDEGAATFEVVHREERRFLVRAGAVSVFDLGTVFAVERDGDRVHVAVESGQVRVEAPGETTQLGAGEARWFDERSTPAPPPQQTVALQPASPATAPTPAKAATTGPAKSKPSAPQRDEVEELLSSADSLRATGKPLEAIALLAQVIAHHRSDHRASVAAFTLGKLLLENDRALEAADAFATTRTLAPQSALFEDALGREIEAATAAGDAARAKHLAQQYLEDFPQGVRALTARKVLAPPP